VVAITLLLPVALLFLILTVRVLTYYVFREVWITYAVLGTLFTLVGVVLWSRRHAGASQA
jgi:ATP/ADP translocase